MSLGSIITKINISVNVYKSRLKTRKCNIDMGDVLIKYYLIEH